MPLDEAPAELLPGQAPRNERLLLAVVVASMPLLSQQSPAGVVGTLCLGGLRGRWLSPEASADLSIFPAHYTRVSPTLWQGTSTSSTAPRSWRSPCAVLPPITLLRLAHIVVHLSSDPDTGLLSETRYLVFHPFSNSSLPAPQTGQTQSSGRSSKGVPGLIPESGSPASGS